MIVKQHTSGPWDTRSGDQAICVYGDGNRLLATVHHCDVEDGVDIVNARLIAAAPGLLKALQTIADMDDRDRPVKMRTVARLAIAKATQS